MKLSRKQIILLSLCSFLILFFIILVIEVKKYTYFPFDLYITTKIQKINNPIFDFYMKLLTNIGTFIPALIITILIDSYLYFIKKRKESLFLLISVVGVEIISFGLKHMIQRLRPSSNLVLQYIKYTSKDSFPSGHVLLYMGLLGFCMFLLYKYKKQTKQKSIIISILIILIISIGISRIYLGAHWFTDVLGSYTIGFLWLNFVIYLYNKYRFINNI